MDYHASTFSARTGAVLLMAVTAFAAGCDDPNYFGADSQRPEITSFASQLPTVAEGDSLLFDVEASGNRNIDRIRMVFDGALSTDTVFSLGDPSSSIQTTLGLAMPMGTSEETLDVQAWALDVADDTSDAVTASVTITDATPPTVTLSTSPSAVGTGELIQLDVTAEDARGLQILQIQVTDGAGYSNVLADTLASPATTYSETWDFVAPDLNIGTLMFTPVAIDINALTASGDEATVELGDKTGPTFLSVATNPDSTIPLADSIQVTVTLNDPAGIQSVSFVGLSYRGDPSMGTDSVVERFAQQTITFPRPTEADTLPEQYTLDPYLQPTDNETTEPVEIFVVATDSLGNESDTTKAMYVGGPDVDITYPADGFEVGVSSTFNVRMSFDDGSGIDSAQLVLGGDMSQTIDLTLPARTDTPFVVEQNVTMPGTDASVTLQARAWNPDEVRGQSLEVGVSVLSTTPTDTEPPVVSVSAERFTPAISEQRMELLDTLRITVSAFDGNSGLAIVVLTVLADRGTQKDTITEAMTFSGSNSLEEVVFRVPVDSLYSLFGITSDAVQDSILPENMDLRIHGYARDVDNNRACSVGTEEQRPCVQGTGIASDHEGLPLRIEAVRGHTVLLDNTEAVIGDLAIDTVYDRLFLSNVSENLVEFVQLDADPRNLALLDPVQVGSQPMGVFMGERVVSSSETSFGGLTLTAGDTVQTLLVANSGGTNVSLVHMDATAANVQEVDVVRLQTGNSVLFELKEDADEFGNVQYTAEWLDLADRPQFLAQDSLLRLVYSTRGTETSGLTTVRFVHADPDPTSTTDEPEVRYMLTAAMVNPDDEKSLALANVDSIDIRTVAAGHDLVRVYMHKPGYPDSVIFNDPYAGQIEDAIDSLVFQIDTIMTNRGIPNQAPMFYPFLTRGTWDLGALSWGDTTFVSASEDRGKIALGEGASSPTGRIMIWHADERATYSDAIEMEDLVNNASEVVLGVGLNENGSLGVARGNEATYFFTPDLRLMGDFAQADVGGAGAAFHPEHDELSDGGHTSADGTGAAFTGTSNHSIDVVNTFHFNEINNLVIRDNVIGPLRAGPPLATDNAGLTCPTDLDCVVVKLYGITAAGGVVVFNVRRRDLEPYATP